MLNRGCEGYLASLIIEDQKLREVEFSIVKEYRDVFPDDLLGRPTLREVEFSIDLVLETAPISKAPYRMAQTELKD